MTRLAITQCSHCATRFRIDPELLVPAGGWAECCECGKVFAALENLVDEAEQRAPVGVGRTPAAESQPPEDESLMQRTPLDWTTADLHHADETPLDEPFESPLADGFDDFAEQRPPPRRRRGQSRFTDRLGGLSSLWQRGNPWWRYGALALGLLLLAQMLGSTMTGSGEDEALLGSRAVGSEQIRLAEDRIRQSESDAGVLTLSLTLQNLSAEPLPFPVLSVRFFDGANRLLAAGEFPPQAYLGHADPVDLPSHLPVPVEMQLRDPGPESRYYRIGLVAD